MAEITEPTALAAQRTLIARHRDIRKAVEGVGDTGINWVPGVETNSIFAVLWHALDAELQAISAAASNPADVPPRDLARKGTEAELLARLDQAEASLEQYLSAITNTAGEVQLYGRTMSVAQALLMATGHVTEHVAHASLTRQLWDQYGATGVLKGVEA